MKFTLSKIENAYNDKKPNLRELQIYQIAKGTTTEDRDKPLERSLTFLIDKSDAAIVAEEYFSGNKTINVEIIQLDTPEGLQKYLEVSIGDRTLDTAEFDTLNTLDVRWLLAKGTVSELVFTEDA